MADDETQPPVVIRQNKGRFVPGRSPNHAGRPKGAKNRKTILAEKLLAGINLPGILARMEKDALKGDKAAAKLILDRCLPARRGMPIAVKLPEIRSAKDCVAAMSVVMAELARGTLSTIEASELTNVIDAAGRSIERIEIETRLAAIEAIMRTNERDEKL